MSKPARPRTGEPSKPAPAAAAEYPEGTDWVPLRDAADAAGVSVSALRKWYHDEQIPSRLAPGRTGQRRLVPLEAVLERAGRHRPEASAIPPRVGPVPEGMALVPAADWERMLSIAVAYAEAGERVGRAEERAEQYRGRLEEARQRAAALEAQLAEERGRFRFRRVKSTRREREQ